MVPLAQRYDAQPLEGASCSTGADKCSQFPPDAFLTPGPYYRQAGVANSLAAATPIGELPAPGLCSAPFCVCYA